MYNEVEWSRAKQTTFKNLVLFLIVYQLNYYNDEDKLYIIYIYNMQNQNNQSY